MQQRHLEEDLALGHAQHLTGLLLPHGDALDAALVDDGEIAGVVDDKSHHAGCHTAIGEKGPDVIIEPLAGAIENDDQLQHQGRAANDPHDHVEQPAHRLAPAAQSKGDQQSQRQGKQQRQEKQLQKLPHTAQQGEGDGPEHGKTPLMYSGGLSYLSKK